MLTVSAFLPLWIADDDSRDMDQTCDNNNEENYHKYEGFVILHGTDTMAYTASALSFIAQSQQTGDINWKPIAGHHQN